MRYPFNLELQVIFQLGDIIGEQGSQNWDETMWSDVNEKRWRPTAWLKS